MGLPKKEQNHSTMIHIWIDTQDTGSYKLWHGTAREHESRTAVHDEAGCKPRMCRGFEKTSQISGVNNFS